MHSRVDQFKSRFEAVRGVVHLAETEEAAAGICLEVCQSADANCCATGPVSDAFESGLATRCESASVTLLRPPFTSSELPGSIDKAQVGITRAEFGIAQTGTLVEVTTNDAHRLVSSLPRTYIGILYANTLIDRLHDAAPKMREYLARHSENCAISFISGPSRTGDIEMILTLGVHGPEFAHAIIIAGKD